MSRTLDQQLSDDSLSVNVYAYAQARRLNPSQYPAVVPPPLTDEETEISSKTQE